MAAPEDDGEPSLPSFRAAFLASFSETTFWIVLVFLPASSFSLSWLSRTLAATLPALSDKSISNFEVFSKVSILLLSARRVVFSEALASLSRHSPPTPLKMVPFSTSLILQDMPPTAETSAELNTSVSETRMEGEDRYAAFSAVLDITGSIGGAMLSFTFPALMFLKVKDPTWPRLEAFFVDGTRKATILLVFGIIVMVTVPSVVISQL